MNNPYLREAVDLLKEEAVQLDRWADESISRGWSTHQVELMRNRAAYLRNRIQAFEVLAHRYSL